MNRGGLSYEIYDNDFQSLGLSYSAFGLRSGTGVIYNNKISGFETNNILVDNPGDWTTTAPLGKCDGSSPYDGNTPGETGWPCLDQIGRGSGSSYGSQPSVPLWAWNNRSSVITVINQTVHIKTTGDPAPHAGGIVDYVNSTTPKPGYVPFVRVHPVAAIDTAPAAAPGAPKNLSAQ